MFCCSLLHCLLSCLSPLVWTILSPDVPTEISRWGMDFLWQFHGRPEEQGSESFHCFWKGGPLKALDLAMFPSQDTISKSALRSKGISFLICWLLFHGFQSLLITWSHLNEMASTMYVCLLCLYVCPLSRDRLLVFVHTFVCIPWLS